MLKKVFIINIFICVIFFGWAFASTQDCESIISMDMLSPDGLNKLESYLSGDNVIAFLKAREKLLTYPYEELKEIRNKIESLDSAKRLKELIDGFITKMEDENIINEVENIFINNIPQSLNAPFYGDFIPDSNIRELSPQAERVYENNLSLKYNKNDLLKKNDTLWVNPKYAGKKSLSIPVQDKSGLDLKVLDNNDKAIRRWQYSLKDDNLRDFFFKSTDLRQWIKKYEESLIFPVTFKNTVILRNEYRIFCLDLKTSNEIWSLGNFDGSGYEFYNTFRHLHENSAGYELLLSDDMLFTELDHKLIALRLDNILEPKIAWQKNLGEFTLGAKPILNKKFLILTLINARSEIFICGFSALDGKLKWTTYIGTSSFLSPACSISCVNGNEVILGTNYGAIISIDSDNGSIIWIRKYSPKQYNIFEYWNKSCLKPYTNNKCPIKYDTEFIQVAGQTLCYKPRESDFFYMIDSKSGELKKQVLVDPEKFYILRVSRNKAVFLEKTNKITKNAVLKVVELSTGKNIYEFEIKGGYLSGVSYLSEEVTLFKCGEFIYLLKAAKDSIECKEIGGHLGGWLVNATRNNFFIADENNLFNYEFKAYQTADTGDLKYTEEQEGILLKTLKEAISLNTGDNKETRLKSSILNLLKQKNISLDKLIPFVIDNKDKFKDNFWNDFIADLNKKYADEIVNYDGVNLRLGGLLYGVGLLKNYDKDKPVDKKKAGVGLKRQYEIYGQSLRPFPVEVIKGSEELDFYLIKRIDQIICVDEFGGIKWFRRTSRADQAYLYEDTLIIKDGVNVVGIDAHSGKYLWSVMKDINNIKTLNSFNISSHIGFIDSDIIIVFDNKMYSLDISTGFSKKSQSLEYDYIKSMHIFKDNIYIVSPLKEISVYGRDISYRGKILLDFLNNNDTEYGVYFIDGFMVFNVIPEAYVIDLEKRKSNSKFFMGDKGKYFLETFNNNLLRIIPSKSVASYKLINGFLALNWEYDFGKQDGQLWGFGLEKTDFRTGGELYNTDKDKYYFISGDKIFLPYHSKEKYYIASLDLTKGKEEWLADIEGVRGIFDNISNVEEYLGKANFIISTKRYIDPPGTYSEYMKDYIADIKPKLVSLDLKKGTVLRIIDLPDDYKYIDYIRPVVIRTKNCYVYGVRGQKIISEVE